MAEQGEGQPTQSSRVDVSKINNQQLEETLKPQLERMQRFLKDPYAQRSLTAASNFMIQFGIASKLGIADREEEGYATMLAGSRFMREKISKAKQKQARNTMLKGNSFTSRVMGPVLRFLDKTHAEALRGETAYRESMDIAKKDMRETLGLERATII